ncbi:AAA family ATPase [Nitrosomonas marina]|uniref:AAA domain-containing protein n=1 Tax=Nitrosomonas marina TaxID=917 RepID=A0A1H8FVX1_9PROT|nr:AAA family ATPase [Nitrosomonas marina]SEN35866.1 AAA domain-containing protein [Nitrosomonas marina]
MLNQEISNCKHEANTGVISDEELNDLRKIEPQVQPAKPYDMARYERLKHRLADELERDNNTLLKIANITKPEDFPDSKYSNNLWYDRLVEWTKNSEKLRQPARYVNMMVIAEVIESALEQYFKELDESRANNKLYGEFVETSVFRKIAQGFLMARDLCRMVEISTVPGSGKTTAAKHFLSKIQKHEGFTCPIWMITLNECNIVSRLITWEIYKTIYGNNNFVDDFGSPEKISEYEMNERITGLCANNPGGLLIIDEAQHIGQFHGNVRPNSLNIINTLRNYCDLGLFGIALLSNGEVYDRAKKTKNSTQLSSRILRVKINKPSENDIDLIMSSWNVAGKREREISIELGTGDGCLRTLTDAYRLAGYKYPDNPISYDTINAALRG